MQTSLKNGYQWAVISVGINNKWEFQGWTVHFSKCLHVIQYWRSFLAAHNTDRLIWGCYVMWQQKERVCELKITASDIALRLFICSRRLWRTVYDLFFLQKRFVDQLGPKKSKDIVLDSDCSENVPDPLQLLLIEVRRDHSRASMSYTNQG